MTLFLIIIFNVLSSVNLDLTVLLSLFCVQFNLVFVSLSYIKS
jgi:hypothetical protein